MALCFLVFVLFFFFVDLNISRNYLKYADGNSGSPRLSICDISTVLYPPTFPFPYLALLFSFTPTSPLLNQNLIVCLFVKSHCALKVFAAKYFCGFFFLLNDPNTSVSFRPCYLWFQLGCLILIPCQHDTGVMETRGWWWSNGFGLHEWRK